MGATTNIPKPGPAFTAGQTNGLRDIKPPVEIPNGWLWTIWITAALVIAGVLLWWYRHWRRHKSAVPTLPPVPPHVRARTRLEEALRLINEPKPFCTLVSDTIRTYLEERFTFHAPDRTTEEFLHELRSTNLLMSDQKE